MTFLASRAGWKHVLPWRVKPFVFHRAVIVDPATPEAYPPLPTTDQAA